MIVGYVHFSALGLILWIHIAIKTIYWVEEMWVVFLSKFTQNPLDVIMSQILCGFLLIEQ